MRRLNTHTDGEFENFKNARETILCSQVNKMADDEASSSEHSICEEFTNYGHVSVRPDLADEFSVPNEVEPTEELKSNADVSSSVPTTPELESETDEDHSSKFGSSDSMNYDCNTEEFEPDEKVDEN